MGNSMTDGPAAPDVLVTGGHPELVWEIRVGGQVAGRAQALDGDTAWITRICIDPHYRGSGYASLLLRAVLAYFPGITVGLAANVWPACRPGLDRSELCAWYMRYGFVPAPIPGDPHRMLRVPRNANEPCTSREGTPDDPSEHYSH